MLRIGCHLSSSKGYEAMGKTALDIKANTFQFFTRNPRGAKAKAIDKEDVKRFLKIQEEWDISPILAHAPYTLNACAADGHLREFARMKIIEISRSILHSPQIIFHCFPGKLP